MSVASVASRYGLPVTLGVVSLAAFTFAITFLADGKPKWWWIVLALGGLGMAVTTVWGWLIQRSDDVDQPASGAESVAEQVAQRDAGVAQQSATGNGTNTSFNAVNGSAAAWNMGTVNLGQTPHDPTSPT